MLKFLLISNRSSSVNDPDLGNPSDKFVIFLMMIRIYLLQSWPTIRSLDKPPIRYLLSAILIFCLLLATCYNSGLASSMTVPRLTFEIYE